MPHKPVALAADEITIKSCATVAFRWVRKSIKVTEGAPALMKSLADDVAQAWKDSAKS